jgi:hypothetical protein
MIPAAIFPISGNKRKRRLRGWGVGGGIAVVDT